MFKTSLLKVIQYFNINNFIFVIVYSIKFFILFYFFIIYFFINIMKRNEYIYNRNKYFI